MRATVYLLSLKPAVCTVTRAEDPDIYFHPDPTGIFTDVYSGLSLVSQKLEYFLY